MKSTYSLGAFSNSSPYQQRCKTNTNSFIGSDDLTDNENSDDESNESGVWNTRPDVWSDDTRMNALFAPFRKRDLNPLHYDNKLKFWKEQINSYCKEKEIIQVDLKSLEGFFIRKKIKPKCLDLVLNEMIKEGHFKTSQDVLKPKLGILRTVFTKCVWSPLAWSTNFILEQTSITSYLTGRSNSTPNLTSDLSSSTLSTNIDLSEKTFVNVAMIESKANDLMSLLQKSVVYRNVDCIIKFEQLKELAKQVLSYNIDEDFELLLKYLEVDQKIMSIVENNQRLVKFTISPQQNVSPVTEIELSYLQLRETEGKLEIDITKIEDEITNLNEIIKTYMKQNNRTSAMKHLKKRKQLEKSLETKENTLSNIQAMLMSIQQADTNKLTYDVFNKGASALKEANKDMNVDKLDETMQDLQDIMQTNTEMEEVMKSPISNRYNFDESELNLELAELLADEVDSKGKNQLENDSMNLNSILENLPNVPTSTGSTRGKIKESMNF